MFLRAMIEKNGTGIEKNGTGVEKNGTGIERNGTGIERNGTGIEKNGTGIRRVSALMACALTVLVASGSVVAEVRGFVTVTDGHARLTMSDDFNLVTGSGSLREGYAMVTLSGMRSCGPKAGLLSEGSGTGSPASEGSGTGKPQSEGSGTGSPNSEGSGTGSPNSEGSGTGVSGEAACNTLLSEGSGTGSPNSEGSGTGSPNSEGSGTGRTQSEGSGTGSPNSEGSGTGSPNAGRAVVHVAEIALDGPTASVIVYGSTAGGGVVELATLELPVLHRSVQPMIPNRSGDATISR